MGRAKKFKREDVLKKAVPLFWAKGYSQTCLQDLEKATGVNKSGLYSEFVDKDDIFVESLRFYYDTPRECSVLAQEPFGFSNIESYLRALAKRASSDNAGCFGVNCMREIENLPGDARIIIESKVALLKSFLLKNVEAEKTVLPAPAIVDVISTFFAGLCIEQNLDDSQASFDARVDALMFALRRM